jgi:DNA polymerase-3 subunit epsilon
LARSEKGENLMVTREDRKALFRQHHYRWRKGTHGVWALIGPDGYETTEQDALKAIQQKQQHPPLLPWQWAHQMQERQALVLDTETTGLEPFHEVIELALVELDGTVVLNTLIACQGAVPADATKIHGINKTMLVDAPTFPDVWAQLTAYWDRDIIIFNAGYDIPMLKQTATRYGITLPRLRSHCLMIQYFEYATGPRRSGYRQENYHRLDAACQHFNIPMGGHRALPDAQAAREVLLHLAMAEQ